MGATDTVGRVAASMGLAGSAELEFRPSADIPNAGVLLSLPALLAVGLLRGTEQKFELPKGFYRLTSIFLLLAFMALARLKSIESLRYCAPGEWGKLLGLDRIPEVRTLRQKVWALSCGDQPTQWSAELCRDWMAAAPENATAFYVDGHVRVYHGEKATLPHHYVARQKLCLRATVEYWVNAMDGQPFFFVHKDIDPKLISVLERDIVPRLLLEVPNQPDAAELEGDKFLHRFTVIFDREGYSPDLLLRMKKLRVACLTYHKHPQEDWHLEEFMVQQVKLASGEVVEMKLAERGVCLTNKLWVREIRRLTQSGHQTSILATDFKTDMGRIAAAMFARWSQENFFKYMRQNFELDRLIEYDVEAIPDPKTPVVNPEYRKLDAQIRRAQGGLNRTLVQLASLKLPAQASTRESDAFAEKKAALDEVILYLEDGIEKLKINRKQTPKHIPLDQLPEGQRFTRLSTRAKHLVDTIKMVAYRAETAMAHVLREKLSRPDDARTLLRAIYNAEADLVPDQKNKTLTVRLHHLANHSLDDAVRHLCQEINSTETKFPDTDLRMVYELVS